jgi:hypothetical protein
MEDAFDGPLPVTATAGESVRIMSFCYDAEDIERGGFLLPANRATATVVFT